MLLGAPVAFVVCGGPPSIAAVLEVHVTPTIVGLLAYIDGALGGIVPWARMESTAAGTYSTGSLGKELP